MAIVRWKPMRDILSVQDEMNRMFDSFFGDSHSENGTNLMPPLDLIEEEDYYLVTAELPGLKKDDIKLTMQDNILTISGSKNKSSETKGDTYYRSERSYGSFYRTVNLPNAIDSSKIKADLADGLLSIRVPKAEDAKPKEITIGVK